MAAKEGQYLASAPRKTEKVPKRKTGFKFSGSKGKSKGKSKKNSKSEKKHSANTVNTASTANTCTSLAIPSKNNPLSFLGALQRSAPSEPSTQGFKIPRKPLPVYTDEHDNYLYARSDAQVPSATSCPDGWHFLDRSKGPCQGDWVDALLSVATVLVIVAVFYMGLAGAIFGWSHKKMLAWRSRRHAETTEGKLQGCGTSSESWSMAGQESGVVAVTEPEMAYSQGGKGL
ncbi:MAG: hypothetical protein LQ342_000871 [Letrouitia transgressa]|nr:MAG: hypothetical protein LQ342_000871 [Letrouitia transgressa]